MRPIIKRQFHLTLLLQKLQPLVRQLLIVCLLLAFAIQTFNRVAIVFDYYTNQSVFIKNCENKSKPQLHCNGRCQMMKKLKHEDNKDQQNPDGRSNTKEEVISSKSFFITTILPISFSERVYYPQLSFSLSKFSTDFFHPPGV